MASKEKFRMASKASGFRKAWATMAAGLLVASMAWAADAPRRPARARRPGRPKLEVGQQAPDFELAPLTFSKNAKGDEVGRIGERKVKLSAFRGKAPICIFSSSYT